MRKVPSLSESQLDQQDDEALFKYMVRVRNAGQDKDFRLALAMLVFRHESNIRAQLRLRLADDEYDIHLDDLVGNVIAHGLRASFDGRHFGEFRSLLNTIMVRSFADFVAKQTKLRTVPLGGQEDDDDGYTGPEPAVDGDFGWFEIQELLTTAMPPNETHCQIIRLSLFDGLRAAEVVERMNAGYENGDGPKISENNVHQVVSRYRQKARACYEESI